MSAQQVVKHLGRRIPLIRFKHGANHETVEPLNNNAQQLNTTQQQNRIKTDAKQLLDFFQLPKKYRRRPIEADELETINVKSRIEFFAFQNNFL